MTLNFDLEAILLRKLPTA